MARVGAVRLVPALLLEGDVGAESEGETGGTEGFMLEVE